MSETEISKWRFVPGRGLLLVCQDCQRPIGSAKFVTLNHICEHREPSGESIVDIDGLTTVKLPKRTPSRKMKQKLIRMTLDQSFRVEYMRRVIRDSILYGSCVLKYFWETDEEVNR